MNGESDLEIGSANGDDLRRFSDTYVGSRVARLAWFELAAAATRRAILSEMNRLSQGGARSA